MYISIILVVKLDDGFNNDKIKIQKNQSIALSCCTYLTAEFSVSDNGKLHRYFINIPSTDIIYAKNPIKSITTIGGEGIKSFHCVCISKDGINARSKINIHLQFINNHNIYRPYQQ